MVLEVLSETDEGSWSRITTAPDGAVFTLQDLLVKAENHMGAHIAQLKELHAQIS
jgi:hypothetical protein